MKIRERFIQGVSGLSRRRQVLGFLGLLLLVLAVWQIQTAHQGLDLVTGTADGVPFQITAPRNSLDGSRPLVLVAHGLAGSAAVMQGYSLGFAHAGYAVASWDFNGHARNPEPMSLDIYNETLVQNVESVLRAVASLKLADTSRLAIVGHSMGSGAALGFGQSHPATSATVAISPVGTGVTPELPHNLLLMAGSLEPDFVENARMRLEEAGGEGGEITLGSARHFEVIPGVEHLSILFAPAAQDLALNWLNATFGVQADARPYRDQRMGWYGLAVLATLMAVGSLIPRVSEQNTEGRPLSLRIAALVIGAFSSTLLLWLVGLSGVEVNTLFGLRVGGYLMLWFFIAGLMGLVVLRIRPGLPSGGELLSGVLIFAALWLGIGLVGDRVWLPWLLIGPRLILWPLTILAVFPWCLLLGECSRYGKGSWRLMWWLIQSIVLFSALILAIKLTPQLGFLMLLLPVFPLVLLFHVLPNLVQRGSWVFALSATLFVSWMLLAVFPLI